MEKRKAHYDLASIKAAFASVDTLRMSMTAALSAEKLGFDRLEVVTVVQSITVKCLYKSMTSDRDSKVWQDVYHVPAGELILYVKFTADESGNFLISFKEK